MTPCVTHTLCVPANAKESASWATQFRKKHGFYPLPCLKCGYLDLDPSVYAKVKLLDLKGSIKDNPELSSLLEKNETN